MENDTNTESGCIESVNATENPPVESAEVDKTVSDSVSETDKDTPTKQQAPVVERERQNSCASTTSDKAPGGGKINILLKPVGDAPILKQKLWAVPSERLVSQITEFVKKYLKLDKHQNLFVFVNQLFAPAPDQCLRDLYECFGSDNKLVLHYSTTVAWG